MRLSILILCGFALTGCQVISAPTQTQTGKLLADGEQVALHEVPAGPTQTALCIAFESASAQIGVPLHPAGSPVPITPATPSP
jgi:hypothetical protein